MIAHLFLTDGTLHQDEVWHRYFSNSKPGSFTAFEHASQPSVSQTIKDFGLIVDTVPNSWAQTLEPHIALLTAAYVATDASHFVLHSESCIPVCSHEKFEATLQSGVSYFDKLGNPWWRAEDRWRRTGKHAWQFLKGHEQWFCMSREHVALCLDNVEWARDMFRECQADNEAVWGTVLNKACKLKDVVKRPTTYTNWPGEAFRARSPQRYDAITPNLIEIATNKGASFLRKVSTRTDCSLLTDVI
jgi:hypothetical protein